MSSPEERSIFPGYPPIRSPGEGSSHEEIMYRQRLRLALEKRENGETYPVSLTISWPFNEGTMRNTRTRIITYHSEASPGITIGAPPESMTIIRSPVDATIDTVVTQPDGRYTVVMVANSNLFVTLKNVLALDPRLEALQGAAQSAREMHRGDIMGTLGKEPLNTVTLQTAYTPDKTKVYSQAPMMLDPLSLLRRLY
jgi:hypothetical protein